MANATRLAGADGGVVYEYDEAEGILEVRATDQLPDDLTAALRAARFRLGEGAVGRAGATRTPVHVEDDRDIRRRDPGRSRTTACSRHALRAGRAAPAREPRPGRAGDGRVGSPGAFPEAVVALLQTFATQSALAIHNARLYAALEEQGRALEEASRHKSAFLANMSHELRTGLLATIGFSELLLEGVYGDLGASQAESVQDILGAGQHVLSLINDALDLAKVEAGRMELELRPSRSLTCWSRGGRC